MNGENITVVLIIASMVLASLSIAGLWWWWQSTGEPEEDEKQQQPDQQNESPDIIERIEEQSVGDIFERLGNWLLRQFDSGISENEVTESDDQLLTPPPTSPASAPQPVQVEPTYSAAVTSPPPAPTATVIPPTATDAVEILRLLRDLADGSLIVEANGQRYHHINQITDPQIRRRVLGSLQDITSFANDTTMPPPAPVPPPTPVVTPPPPQEEVVTPSTPSPAPIMGDDEDEEEDNGPVTMAQEIEELLQYRLTRSSDLMLRSIHIRDAAGGGVLIDVDGIFYQSVADIPDEQIKEFIRDVIQEWEARQ